MRVSKNLMKKNLFMVFETLESVLEKDGFSQYRLRNKTGGGCSDLDKAGKTILFRMLLGLIKPDTEILCLDG